jgi:hypothetical protein
VCEEFATLLKSYNISRVTGDAYAGEWPRERLASHGITYDVSTRNKSAIYTEFLPALNGQRVRLLDLPRLTGQLVSLERRTARGGRDSIDHAPGAHDDLANAVCGVLVNMIADRRPALVRRDDMLADGAGYPIPLKARYIVAFLIVDAKGIAATVYAAAGFPEQGPALVILDFDAGPLHGGIFVDIVGRLRSLCAQCRTNEAGLFVSADMLQHAGNAGLNAQEIPKDFAAEDRLLSVAAHVASGHVKICAPALEKAKTSPFAGALDLRAGENVDDPLRAALVTLVGLGLDAEQGRTFH